MQFPDLGSFVAELERTGELKRVRVEVDPIYEVAEIAQRLVREDGPAVIFERVKGAQFPLVMNLFGSMKRVELALGRHPEEIGKELVETVLAVNPPSLKGLWSRRGVIARARHMLEDPLELQ